MGFKRKRAALLLAVGACATAARAADWPMWGGTTGRNMVVPAGETNLPTEIGAAKPKAGSDDPDPASMKNVRWVARLGSNAYGNPTVAGRHVYVGTNNDNPRDPKYAGDHGVLLCLDEATGKLVWELAVPKLAAGANVDSPDLGLCSSPAVDGDRVYVVTNRCEVLCLDAAGMANGNDGPFADEPAYVAGPGQPPIPSAPTDADIVWRYDMRHDLGVVPRKMTSSSVLVVGDRVYVATCNGMDWTEKHVPAPWAPALICLDKKTGKLLGREQSGIGARPFFGSWSCPSFGTVAGKPTVVFAGGDGFCYGFDPEPVPGGPDGGGVLREVWRVDGNPPGQRVKDGKPVTSRGPKGPSEFIATPVVVDDRVYVAVGQLSEGGLNKQPGCMTCIGATPGGKVDALWRNATVGQTMCTASVAGGLVYVADAGGKVSCLDGTTGEAVWDYDTEGDVWSSTLLADGKVYVGTESGELHVLAAGREKKPIGKMDLGGPIYASPVVANGTLYVATSRNLLALRKEGGK